MRLVSWGMYPKVKNSVTALSGQVQCARFMGQTDEFIPFGNGRSYGDSAINSNILHTINYNHIHEFNEERGLLKCQSRVLLSDIIEVLPPKGWFLKVTPGTKLITIGGAIASDVHGKNHHTE